MIHPYRFFSGTCREAMTWYQQVIGGELDIMGIGDLPPGEEPFEGADPETVMHAALTFPDGTMLMASDDPTGDGGPANGVSLHLTVAGIDDGARIFAALCDDGEVEMPFEEVFWALRFGACTDRFGTSWMVSVDHPSGEEPAGHEPIVSPV